MLRTTLAKLLTAKAAAVVTVAGAGGIALAAGTGVLPVELPNAPATLSAVSSAPARSSEPPSSAANPGAANPRDGAAGTTPSPSMVGLCNAYAAEAGSNPGEALQNPAFTVLITAAGGADKVGSFCQTQTSAPELPDAAPSATQAPPAADGNRNDEDHAKEGSSHAQVPPSPQHPAGPPTAIPTIPTSGIPGNAAPTSGPKT